MARIRVCERASSGVLECDGGPQDLPRRFLWGASCPVKRQLRTVSAAVIPWVYIVLPCASIGARKAGPSGFKGGLSVLPGIVGEGYDLRAVLLFAAGWGAG